MSWGLSAAYPPRSYVADCDADTKVFGADQAVNVSEIFALLRDESKKKFFPEIRNISPVVNFGT